MDRIAEYMVRPSWLHWPTWDTFAYHLGAGGGLSWFGFYSAVVPWVALIGILGAVVCAVLSWVSSIALPSWLSWFGPIGAALAKVNVFLRIAAYVLAVLGLVAYGFWFSSLLATEAQYKSLNGKVLALEDSLGCLARKDQAERDLFACVPAQQRDAETEKETAVEQQRQAGLQASEDLSNQLAAAQAQVSDLQVWREQHKSEDGPLPQNLLDYYAKIGGSK
jgi:hypothetical protein